MLQQYNILCNIVSGTTLWPDCLVMSVCCSPAALRETPPAPPVTLLRYPAVNRSEQQQQQQQPHPQLRQPQLQLKVKTKT